MNETKTKEKHIAESVIRDGILIVLRKWKRDEWVTHLYRPENNSYLLGHYFIDYENAVCDFFERCGKEKVSFKFAEKTEVRAGIFGASAGFAFGESMDSVWFNISTAPWETLPDRMLKKAEEMNLKITNIHDGKIWL